MPILLTRWTLIHIFFNYRSPTYALPTATARTTLRCP